MNQTNQTHDPALRSWVASANEPGADFPIQNLPFGVFRTGKEEWRVGVAIGDHILDLAACEGEGLLRGTGVEASAVSAPSLNALMALGPEPAARLRARLSEMLAEGSPGQKRVEACLVRMEEAEMGLPATVGDYTDFYASLSHATHVGRMFRPDNPLLPNYKHIPIGYHGRASSIVPSGTAVRRPCGQRKSPSSDAPEWGASRLLDYEAEVGVFVGPGNPLGETIPLGEAERHLWGLCLVNDWSARDIQSWEYQPLGPFLAKSFATTVSPWVVTLEALAPFRVPAYRRAEGDPEPLPYLQDPADRERGGFALTLEVWLRTPRMREAEEAAVRITRAPFTGMYWTLAQMLTHHASNGCNLRPGDLLASGTVSGEAEDARGCLLELTWRGEQPLRLPNGEERRFLEDGDEVILRGFCEKEGWTPIGLGECRGVVLPAAGE